MLATPTEMRHECQVERVAVCVVAMSGAPASSRRWSPAAWTAALRPSTPSLRYFALQCVLTLLRDTYESPAISRCDSPDDRRTRQPPRSPPVEQQDRTGWIGSPRSEASLGFRANLASRDGGALAGADSLDPSLDLVGPHLFEFVDRHLIWLTEARKEFGCDVGAFGLREVECLGQHCSSEFRHEAGFATSSGRRSGPPGQESDLVARGRGT